MAPAQGSKFAVLASPDEEVKKSSKELQNQAKGPANKKKNAAKKQLAKAMEETLSKPAPKAKTPPPVPKAKSPTTKTSSSSSSSSTSSSPKKQAKKVGDSSLDEKTCPVSGNSNSITSSPPKPPGSTIQSIFLWAVSACYLFAFVSFYYQVRGLYGDDGILPLRHLAASLSPKNQSTSAEELYASTGSIVWLLAGRAHLSLTSSTEIVALAGVLLSALQLLFASFRVAPNYLVLYFLYYSLSSIGQTFLSFQWDALLLEVGVLTALVSVRGRLAPDSRLLLWPARWALFKLMFSSGVVKLTSRCPLWWSLRALDVHFESQCLPTPLAWYAHQLPPNWLHLATALTYLLEIGGPFLFFLPFRSARRFSFVTQVAFQLFIILTGNYAFFNLLTLTLCISLLECPSSSSSCPAAKEDSQKKKTCPFSLATQGIFFGLIGYLLVHYFSLSLDNVGGNLMAFFTVGPSSKVNFSLEEFNVFLGHAIGASFWLGGLSLTHVSVRAVGFALTSSKCIFTRSFRLVGTIAAIALCTAALTLSAVPLAELDTSGGALRALPAPVVRWYGTAHERGLVSGYGLFRVMTGEGGRPELVVEGNNDPNGEAWRPYHFKYKPGQVDLSPRFNVPHQPRLDWQMWFAALGSYQNNPWLLNLAYRLLTGSPDVLHLLDAGRLPFPPGSPPKFLRVSRYSYSFTGISEGSKAWWKQTTNRHAYMPLVSKDTIAGALKLDEIAPPLWVQRLAGQEVTEHSTVKAFLDALYEALVLQGSSVFGFEPQHLMILIVALAFAYQWSRCTHGKKVKGQGCCPMMAKGQPEVEKVA